METLAIAVLLLRLRRERIRQPLGPLRRFGVAQRGNSVWGEVSAEPLCAGDVGGWMLHDHGRVDEPGESDHVSDCRIREELSLCGLVTPRLMVVSCL